MTLRSWLLSLLVSALAISSLHLWRHRNKPQPLPVADMEAEEMVALAPVPRLGPELPAARLPVRKPAATGMATIRGQVLGGPEPLEDPEATLTLVVSDEEDEFEAELEADGSFTIELAPGTYRFHAQLEEMTATLEAVTVAAEEDKEVVLQLSAGVSIKGTLRPPNDEKDGDGHDDVVEEINVRFHIRLSGESEWSESENITVKDNQFTITGLEAGKRYDLSFAADGFRPMELAGIPAPSDGLFANLVRLARLRGGFGIARGEKCPISEVTIVADNDEQAQVAMMDHFCRFQTDGLPPANRVRVQVSEADWQFDVLVDIPPHGDPPFVCLKTLCREPAPDELSTLEISLVDSPDKSFFATIIYDHIGIRTQAAAGEVAQASGIPSGKKAAVNVFARSCRPMDQTLVLQPGVNRLTMACQKR